MIPSILGALAIGLSLGILGSGGSILTVPSLVYLVGQDEKIAIAGSLAIVGAISLVGAIPYGFKRLVDWSRVLLFGVPGMIGTWLGARLSGFVSGSFQLGLFAAVMLLAAAFMLRPVKLADRAAEARPPQAIWRIVVDGLLVGVLTGLVGVGGGFLIVPALVLLGGVEMRIAVGTSLCIIAMKSFSGFLKYRDMLGDLGLGLDYEVLGLFSGVGIVGTLVGGRLSTVVPQAALRRAFGVVLVVMAVAILSTRWSGGA